MDNSVSGENYTTSGSRVSWGRWIAIGCVLIVLACISLICVVGLLNSGIRAIGNEQSEVETVIDRFMTDMANKENDNIASMFVERLERTELQEQLEAMDYAYFDGYRSLSVSNFRVSQQINTNPMTPQGTVASLNGTIEYTEGFTGTFDAVLEKHDEEWLFFGININVSPEKIRATEDE